MDASIIIAVYNRSELLSQVLSALAKQTYTINKFEVVIVDDGSTENIELFIKKFNIPFNLKFIKNNQNRGRAVARNIGINNASSDLIIFLDSDMIAVPELVEKHIEYHKKNENAVGIGNIITSPTVNPTALSKYYDIKGVHKCKAGDRIPYRYFVSGNSSVRKKVLLDVGLFDENFVAYGGEDLELAYRLHKIKNVEFGYIESAISYHLDVSSIEKNCERMYEFGRTSFPYLIKKHPELKTLWSFYLSEKIDFSKDDIIKIVKKSFLLLVCNNFFYSLIKLLSSNIGFNFLTIKFIDYLIYYNIVKGYSDYERNANK
jgi:glycosyltransferase involved in cell wall biosynthesis